MTESKKNPYSSGGTSSNEDKESATRGAGENQHRMQKIDRELREIVALYITQEMRGLLPGLVTVGRVVCSRDLRQAKVYVSVFTGHGEEGMSEAQVAAQAKENREQVLDVLDEATSEIQHYINRQVRMKYVPKLEFYLDETVDEIFRVQAALEKIKS
jgi:ribosome-binding factor A